MANVANNQQGFIVTLEMVESQTASPILEGAVDSIYKNAIKQHLLMHAIQNESPSMEIKHIRSERDETIDFLA